MNDNTIGAVTLYIHRISTGKCSDSRVIRDMKRAKRVTQTSSDHTFVNWVFIRDKEDDEIMEQVGSSDGFLII